jgi:hypothetical protein
MTEWTRLDWFVLGLVIGYCWHPLWDLGKKILHEAKEAKHAWRNPGNRNDRDDQDPRPF